MAIKINVNGLAKEVVDTKINVNGASKQVDQIWVNVAGESKLVWENWKFKTGNLVYMTSNNAPSPFYCTRSGFDTGSTYYVFDSDASNEIGTWNTNVTGDAKVTLFFGKLIKIRKFTAKAKGGNGATKFRVYGILHDDTEVQIGSFESTDIGIVRTMSWNGDEEFKGIKLSGNVQGGAQYFVRQLFVAEWYEK